MEGTRVRRNGYAYDNLARKYSVEEEKHQLRVEKIRTRAEKNKRETAQAHTRINYGIDVVAAIVLSLAMVCMLRFALQYLTLSSEITALNKSVSNLSTELSTLKSENDEAYAAVKSTVDMGEVYETAVGELGMVYPDENQIVEYDYVEEGYVKQYKDVPSK